MNKIKLLAVSLLAFLSTFNLWANPTEITQAFASGNISKIESYLNSNVDITIDNASNSCNRDRAKSILSDFFRKNRPSNYSLTNKTEKGKSAIVLGKLYTNGGEFSLFILTQKEANKDMIYQVKITKEK